MAAVRVKSSAGPDPPPPLRLALAAVGEQLKAIYVTRFRGDLTREQAGSYWTGVHAPMAAGLGDMVGYVQNHVVGPVARHGSGGSEEEPRFDGYACEWWRDRERYEAGMATETWQAIVDDGPLVFDVRSLAGMCVVVDERVVLDGLPASGTHKLAFVVRFKPGLSREEAARYWLEVHGPLGLRQAGVVRYVQNLVTGAIGEGGAIGPVSDAGFDGLAELWFKDAEAWALACESAATQALYRDSFEFLDMTAGASDSATVAERVIKPA